MLQQQNYILNTEDEYRMINSVKTMIEEIHDSGDFFNLSLKTLELIRRFNRYYSFIIEENKFSSSDFHQLVVISSNLEAEIQRSL